MNSFSAIYKDKGTFEYFDDSFRIIGKEFDYTIKWTEVNYILGYKKDLLSVDTICLELRDNGGRGFTICEETQGWYQFVLRSKAALPDIHPGWDADIALPPFQRKLTLIYDRQKRNLDEVMLSLESKDTRLEPFFMRCVNYFHRRRY